MAGSVIGALAACAAPDLPERRAAVAAPGHWSAADSEGEATIGVAWWSGFGDPLLTELVTRALAGNTDIRAAQARLRQAGAAREQAWALLRPSATAGGAWQRTFGAKGSALVQGSLEAGWDIDLFGGARRAAQAATLDLQASDADLANTRVAVAAEIAVGYIQLRASQARLAIARDSLATQEQTLEITRWRALAGLISSVDVEQLRTLVAQTQAQLPPLEAAVAQAGDALGVMLGEAPLTLRPRLAVTAGIPEPPAELTLAVPAETLRRRPDVRAAELAVEAAAARVAQSRASQWPSFLVRGSLAWSAVSLGASGTTQRLLAGSTSLPLLDGGNRHAQQQSREALFEAAQAAYDASVLAALQEVEDLLAAIQSSRARLEALGRAAEAAANAATLANHRYAGGLADFQTVLETQRSLLASLDGVAAARAELAVGHVRLYRALGGGWSSAAGAAGVAPPS